MTNDKELSFEDRKTLAIKEMEAICRKYEVDTIAVLTQVGTPEPSAIALMAQLHMIDLKGARKLTTPGSAGTN